MFRALHIRFVHCVKFFVITFHYVCCIWLETAYNSELLKNVGINA